MQKSDRVAGVSEFFSAKMVFHVNIAFNKPFSDLFSDYKERGRLSYSLMCHYAPSIR